MTDTNSSPTVCESCGGAIRYDAVSETFRCASCGRAIRVVPPKSTIDEYAISGYRLRESSSAPLSGVYTAKCPGCGAEVFFEAQQTAKRCPMCAGALVRSEAAQSGIAPEGVVPFRVDPYEAQKRFGEWIKKRWFAPNELKKAYAEGALEGLYVPFWTYDADVKADYSGFGGRTRMVRTHDGKTTAKTDWFPASGTVYRAFDDLLVCGSSNVSGTLAERVAPFNTVGDIKPFTPQFLTGYSAERYSIDGESCFRTAQQRIESAMRSAAQNDIMSRGYDCARVSACSVMYKDVTYKNVLCPMYTAAYGYHSQTYHYAINGETGRVSGNYPKSAAKITLAVIAGIILLSLAMWLFGFTDNSSSSYDAFDDFGSGWYDYLGADMSGEAQEYNIRQEI